MSLTEERMQILKMLEEGTISADEASTLIAALETGSKKNDKPAGPILNTSKSRWLRIRVTDEASGRQKVSVNLPINLVSVALRMGAKFAPEVAEMDMEELAEIINSGVEGKIIDVQDDEDGERVEIFVE